MTPFHDLNDYMGLPRLTGLRLAPDGSWLAVTVAALSPMAAASSRASGGSPSRRALQRAG